jgi:transposase-like protein
MNNQTIEELNNRYLDKCLFSIMVFPTKIYLNDGKGNINIKKLYVFYGCTIHGVRKYITSAISDNFTKVSDWYNFLMALKGRKLEHIFYALIPNNNLLNKALTLAFPDIIQFISSFEVISKISNYYSISYSSGIDKIIKKIYLSESITEYEMAINEFYDNFKGFEFIYDLLAEDFKYAKKIYSYYCNIRKMVYSYYFSRDMLKILTKISHSKASFSNCDEFIQELIPYIKTNETKMFCSKKDWSNIINILYKSKKELIMSYL